MRPVDLPFGLTVCGISELSTLDVVATHVVSILDPKAPVPEAFGHFGEHFKLELRFDDIIEETPDQIPPGQDDVDRILHLGRSLTPDARLLVHCHAGISRSTAALALILAQALPERSGAAIIEAVHGLREKAWPNLRLLELGDATLGRNGDLVAAAGDLYRLQIEKRPMLVDFMQKSGRQRELDAAAGDRPNLR